jgi:D-sedoheptulose 7-phosphate isomerase
MSSIQSSLAEVRKIAGTLDRQLPKVMQAAEMINRSFQAGHKLLAAGNGGSAADAQHFTCEFEGKFRTDRPGYPALCLCTSASFLTAWSNDYSFDSVFVRQVEAHGTPGDVFVGISTSGGTPDGCSRNVGLAAARASELGLATIGLAGKGGGMLGEIADVCIVVESNTTARVQEAHGILLHLIVEAFEELALSGDHAGAAGVLAQAGAGTGSA